MSDFHGLRVESQNKAEIEKVAAQFLKQKLLWAREQTWKIFHVLKQEIREGMSEREGFQLAMKICADHKISKHWHKPSIRFGPGTVQTFHEPLQESYRLQVGDPVYLDLGPVWADSESSLEYEGDVGDTFAFGENPEVDKCAQAARDLFVEAEAKWKLGGQTGSDLHRLLKEGAAAKGYTLIEKIDGHRVGDFPHQKYSRERLSKIEFEPAPLLWVLELQIRHLELEIGAFYEDLLGISCEIG